MSCPSYFYSHTLTLKSLSGLIRQIQTPAETSNYFSGVENIPLSHNIIVPFRSGDASKE